MKKSIKSMFNNIQNNQGIHQLFITLKSTNFSKNILKVLICKGFIRNFFIDDKNTKKIKIYFKYYKNFGALSKITLFDSKSYFVSYLTLCKFKNNNDLILISTNCGVLTRNEAILKKVGGFLLCRIF